MIKDVRLYCSTYNIDKKFMISDSMLGMPSHEIFFIQEGGKDTLGNVKGHQRFFPYLIK